MLKFPTKVINNIKNLLTRQQKEIEKNLKEVQKEDPVSADGLVESSEPGTDSYMADAHTKTVAIEETLKKTNSSIKAALLKIKNKAYGKCEKCGNQIEIGRLLAMPMAQFCLSCSKKINK